MTADTHPIDEGEPLNSPVSQEAASGIRKLAPVYRYVLAVCVLGAAAVAAAFATGTLRPFRSAEAAVFAMFVVLGELLPIIAPRKGEQDEITISATFSLALLLTAGLAPAMLAQVIASVISDVARRKPVWKAAFNGGQYALSLSGAAVTLSLLSTRPAFGPDQPVMLGSLPAILAAGAVFFVINFGVTGVALALAQGIPVVRYLARDVRAQLPTDGVLLALVPIVLLSAETSLLVVPLIVVPMVAIYHKTRVSLENASLVGRLEESLSGLREMNRLNEHMALHDALTGLPNRMLFIDRVTQAIRLARREGHWVALLMVDLDRFKEINDTLGHHDGDLLLQEIGHRLEEALRESDTVARVGGDEFGVLVPVLAGSASIFKVADRIRDALDEPIVVEGLVLHVEASIGISVYPEHGPDADTLMQRADLAMYAAKGGNLGYQLYANKYDQHSRRRVALLGGLRRAMDSGQLVLHWQPKVSMQSGRVVGVEALIRWQRSNGTLIYPNQFIPLAEHTGLIRPLTKYVLEAALRQAREWADSGLHLSIAVNLSARDVIDVQLPQNVARSLEASRVPAERLDLEITESALMGEARAVQVLTNLSEMGVSLSLDDFGTGYSSLASIKRLPVNEIKVDRSLVMNMTAVDSDAVIVRSTVDLGHNLGLRVVAEGVESEEIWNRLIDLRCDVAQGFYLSRPLPAADVPAWVRGAKSVWGGQRKPETGAVDRDPVDAAPGSGGSS